MVVNLHRKTVYPQCPSMAEEKTFGVIGSQFIKAAALYDISSSTYHATST